MIVSRRGDALVLVEQVEHGRVAGELAAAWGTDDWVVAGPRASVVTAAARHDEGWRAWDARVLFDELARRPLHFTDIDVDEHVRLYRQGLERVSLGDVYAGVLVGMHWTGLYRGRWSAPGAAARLGRDERDRRTQDAVVDAEERRWIEARRQAWTDDEPRSVFETRLWHSYDLLQVWDLLSLYLAVTPPGPPAAPGAEPALWGPQLRELEHRAVDVRLPAVAPRPGADRVPITVSVVGAGVLALDPFPFAADVELSVAQRTVPDRRWTHDEVTDRLRRAPVTTTTWRLVPLTGAMP